MTVTEAKKIIYRKCQNCKWWTCDVWDGGTPAEDYGKCALHGFVSRDCDEDACRSFDYANWAIRKTITENENEAGE